MNLLQIEGLRAVEVDKRVLVTRVEACWLVPDRINYYDVVTFIKYWISSLQTIKELAPVVEARIDQLTFLR